MGKEVELKYVFQNPQDAGRVFDDTTVQVSLSGSIRVIDMRSEYYDTADGALSQLKAALRRRTENQVTVFTLKTSEVAEGALSVRGEWEVRCDTLSGALDYFSHVVELASVLGKIRCQELIKTVSMEFTRTCGDVRFSNVLAELCVDEGYFFHAGRSAPFSELELELKQGSFAALQKFGDKLKSIFCLVQEPQSKLVRALGV